MIFILLYLYDLDLSNHRICIWLDHRICIWLDHRICIWSNHRICIWSDHRICIWSDYRICIWSDHRICIWSDDSESDLDLIRTSCLDLSWLIRCLWSRFEQMINILEFHCFITLSDKFPLPVLGHRWEKLLKYIDRFLNKYRVQSNEKKSNAKKCPKASSKNIPVGLPSSPIKILGKSVKGLWVMIGQTKRQTNRDYNLTYIDKPPLAMFSYNPSSSSRPRWHPWRTRRSHPAG